MSRAPKTGTGTRPIPRGIRGTRVADAMIRNPKLLGPSTTIAQVHEFFGDDHVHAALLVDHGRLLAVIEPHDLIDSPPATYLAMAVGRLRGRVTKPEADLATTWETMTALSRRRLAVVDDRGEFVGLLCLKSSGLGFCSDADVRARAEDLVSRL